MKKLQYLLMTLSVLCLAVPAFAQSGTGVVNLAPIGIGIGLALAAGLCGLGQGKATASAVEALARNPGARPGIFTFHSTFLSVPHSLGTAELATPALSGPRN